MVIDWSFIHQLLFFQVLLIIFASLIVDLFVCIDWISVYWFWNLSLLVIENCPWAVSKPDIQICFTTGSWNIIDMILVWCSELFASSDCFDWPRSFFKSFAQAVLCLFLTCVYHVYWIIFNWYWNLSLCVIAKFSVGHIQTGHMDFLPPQVCGMLLRGFQFLWFNLLQSMHWLYSRHIVKLSKFEVV